MLENIEEKLLTSLCRADSQIDKAIEAIERLIKNLLAQKDLENVFLNNAEVVNDNSRDSIDKNIELLRNIESRLLEQKDENHKILEGLLEIFDNTESSSRVYGAIRVISESAISQARRCEVAYGETKNITEQMASEIETIIHNDKSSEILEILDVINEYKNAANELASTYRKAAHYLHNISLNSKYNEIAFECLCGMAEPFDDDTCELPDLSPHLPINSSDSQPDANVYDASNQAMLSPSADAPIQDIPKENHSLFVFFKKRKKNTENAKDNQAVPPPQVDSVQFSAIAPEKVLSGKYFHINVVMYEDAYRKSVDNIIKSHKEKMRESQSGYRDVVRNSSVRVILASPDVQIDDCEEELIWNGKYLNFEFAAKVPENYIKPQILITASVYINGIISSKLKMILDCADSHKRNISISREDILSAFVSYASQDRGRVAAIIQGMKKARPDLDIFFDIESLRSGEHWEEILKAEIEKRDILFLCWSKFARDSEWVNMEWRYALESKGEEGIEPIPIDSPDICPPPIELQQKHFNDRLLYIIQANPFD